MQEVQALRARPAWRAAPTGQQGQRLLSEFNRARVGRGDHLHGDKRARPSDRTRLSVANTVPCPLSGLAFGSFLIFVGIRVPSVHRRR
jgi:hypothetical protein